MLIHRLIKNNPATKKSGPVGSCTSPTDPGHNINRARLPSSSLRLAPKTSPLLHAARSSRSPPMKSSGHRRKFHHCRKSRSLPRASSCQWDAITPVLQCLESATPILACACRAHPRSPARFRRTCPRRGPPRQCAHSPEALKQPTPTGRWAQYHVDSATPRHKAMISIV